MLNRIRKALGMRTHHTATRTSVVYKGQHRMAVVIDPDAYHKVIVK